MSHYRPYPTYKDSGIEWIGEVPEHWNIVPIKVIADVLNGATPSSSVQEYWDGDIAWYTPTDIDNDIAKELGTPKRYITQAGFDSCAVRLAPPGSVILSTRAPIGSIGITKVASTINQGCRTLVPLKGVPAKFLASILVANRAELRIRGNGTTFQELSTEALRSLRIAIPEVNEIISITKHINHETTRIDTLIAKKTRFIELLKEKRQAFITHAVTKGLDLHVKMKDSGIEWIGEVPEHWNIVPIKVIADVLNGATPSSSVQEYWDGDIAWYTPTDIDNDIAKELGTPKRYITQAGFDSCAVRLAPPGSVILSTRAPIGSIGITKVASTINQGCRTLVPLKGVPAKFLASILVANRAELRIRGNGTTFQELSTEALRSLRIAIPEVNEIISITKHINHETTRIDTLIEKTQRSIELLKERRSAFITAAVTGQIDLREEKP